MVPVSTQLPPTTVALPTVVGRPVAVPKSCLAMSAQEIAALTAAIAVAACGSAVAESLPQALSARQMATVAAAVTARTAVCKRHLHQAVAAGATVCRVG